MAVTMVREAWTDERLDEGFREVRAEIRELRAEIGQVREGLGELRAEINGLEKKFDAKFEAVDKRFDDVIRTMQIGFGLIGAVLAALVGMVATQL
jgi:predicted nuclease with TOPRIM domain